MTWETFYLTTFLVGFLLSLAAFFAGSAHGGHFHGHGHGHALARGGGGRGGVARFNFAAVTAFLAWFGGAGYLLERYSDIWTYLGLLIASASGFAGASVGLVVFGKAHSARAADGSSRLRNGGRSGAGNESDSRPWRWRDSLHARWGP